jgi:hypothetical protein
VTTFDRTKGPLRAGEPRQEFIPNRPAPLLAFLSGVLALLLVAGWLSRLA